MREEIYCIVACSLCMDIAEFVRKDRDDIVKKRQKHVFWSDLTEAFGSIYTLR
jgi:hypothetical protein